MSFNYEIKNPTTFRQGMRTKFVENFCEPHGIDTKFAVNLEIGAFNFTIQESNKLKLIKKWDNPAFVTLYINRLRTLFVNLNNLELINLVKNEELTSKVLAFMTHQEMNPAHWKDMIEQKMRRDAVKFSTNVEAMTDMFVCKKCKSRKCTYYELQTRSADEPSTIFISCLDCGKHWKQ
jgi:transcription elongation factor S-II